MNIFLNGLTRVQIVFALTSFKKLNRKIPMNLISMKIDH